MDMTTQAPGNHRAGQAVPDNTERYLYQIRNMLAWMLVLAVLVFAGGIVTGIVIASHHSPSATCQSLGGTDTSC